MNRPSIIIFDSLNRLDDLNINYKLVDFKTIEDALEALSTGATIVGGKVAALEFNSEFYDLAVECEDLRNKISKIIKNATHSNSKIIPSTDRIFYIEDDTTGFKLREVFVFSDWIVTYRNPKGEPQYTETYYNTTLDEIFNKFLTKTEENTNISCYDAVDKNHIEIKLS